MSEQKNDGIVKAWRAMDKAVAAIRNARQKCDDAAGAINSTTSAVKNELRNTWRSRAMTLLEMIEEITGK